MRTFSEDQLPLFPGANGGIDLARLRQRREGLQGRPRSYATVKSYASDWRSFTGWCSAAGRKSLPADAETISLYVTWLLTADAKRVSTAQRHLASIADAHRKAGHPVPVTSDARNNIACIKRERREQPKGKDALAVPDLVRAARSCDVTTVRGIRDRAIIVLGFATSARRSELARLQLSDLTFTRNRLCVRIGYGKTDQEGRGRDVPVWAGKRASTDPLRVVRAWIVERGRWDGPLFCRIQTGDTVTKQPLKGQAIAEVVKEAAARAGLDAKRYAGHSLRAGAVTASADLGRSDQEIMRLSGHSSASVMKMYVRSANVFSGRNPLAGVL
jgi:site-specific recombinase XerD